MKFQILDADYSMVNGKPMIRLFGKDKHNLDVCGFYEGFLPYFYVLPKKGKDEELKKRIKEMPYVNNIETVERFLPHNYQKEKTKLIKITLNDPSKIATNVNSTTEGFRDLIKKTNLVEKLYEADILFKYRFMSDLNLKGMSWVEGEGIPFKTSTVKSMQAFKIKDIKPYEEKENAELKCMAFDIETLSSTGGMPNPKEDQIIIISIYFKPKFDGKESVVLTTKNISGGDIESFTEEKEMLEFFVKIIDNYNPDILTGFNISNFDLPHLISRMGISKVARTFGRCASKNVTDILVGGQHRINIVGRCVVDSYQLVKREFSLKRYNLMTVAKELIQEDKMDIKYTEITRMWNSNEQDKLKKLIDYCRDDSRLAMKLLTDKNLLDKYIEISKLTGVLLQDVLDGGEAGRVEQLLLNEFNKRESVIPCKPSPREIRERIIERDKHGLKGGFVLDPVKGLHADGLTLVLDFTSMYPSIFRTYNICPTTLLPQDMEVKDFIKTQSGARFIKPETREGIIPKILETLMEERSKVKGQMLKTRNKEEYRQFYAKQYALKVTANAFYGYTGYLRAKIYVLDVANAVTASGRYLIKTIKSKVENEYNYKIIYGDTDSIIVKIDVTDLEQGLKIGKQISKEINNSLEGVLKVDYEKCYRSLLILTKKRYAGWKFEKRDDAWEETIETKGIETVRRDWCDLISEVMQETLSLILKKQDITGSLVYIKKTIGKLAHGEIPIQKLVITKSITKRPDQYDGIQPHVELFKKMQRRNLRDPPVIGSRIGYVIIKGRDMLSKRAEDPTYVLEHNLQTDSDYYIRNQLLPPIQRIFSAIGISESELLGRGKQLSLSDAVNNTHNKNNVAKFYEGIVCSKCDRFYSRPPLAGKCVCGGTLLFSAPGNSAEHLIS